MATSRFPAKRTQKISIMFALDCCVVSKPAGVTRAHQRPQESRNRGAVTPPGPDGAISIVANETAIIPCGKARHPF